MLRGTTPVYWCIKTPTSFRHGLYGLCHSTVTCAATSQPTGYKPLGARLKDVFQSLFPAPLTNRVLSLGVLAMYFFLSKPFVWDMKLNVIIDPFRVIVKEERIKHKKDLILLFPRT